MKRVAFYALAVALAVSTLSLQTARANGTATGQSFQISLQELPDVCPTGLTMVGYFEIDVFKSNVKSRQLFNYQLTVETPFGPAIVEQGNFRLWPGAQRTMWFKIPVSEAAPLGMYKMTLTVSTKSESLTVDHQVLVVRNT